MAIAVALALGGAAQCQDALEAESSSGKTATVTFGGGALPTAVAVRLGTEPFALSGLRNGKVTVSLPPGTTDVSVAYRCPEQPATSSNPASIFEEVVNLSTKDLTSETIDCPVNGPPAGKTGKLTFSVNAYGVAGGENEIIEILAQNRNYGSESAVSGAESTSSMQAPIGADRVDVLVYAYNMFGGYNSDFLVADRMDTDQGVPGALYEGNQVVLGEADRTGEGTIRYENVPSGFRAPTTEVYFQPAGTAEGFLTIDAFGAVPTYPTMPVKPGDSYSLTYTTMPADVVKPGDTYFFTASAESEADNSSVSIKRYQSKGGAQTMTFPGPWSYSGPKAASLPTFQFNYKGFDGKPGVSRSAMITWSPSSKLQVEYFVSSTQHYAGGTAALALPNLSEVKGFLTAPAAGASVAWTASLSQSSAGYTDGPWKSEVDVREVSNQGEFRAP